MLIKKLYLPCLLMFFILLSSGPIKAQSGADQNVPPNIIIIFMDDMGYGDLSSAGHPSLRTPNIDRLSTEGQKWTNFYTASSVCSPSRGALLTGRYPIRIGLAGENKRVFFPESTGGLPSNEITIAEMLKQKGYKTGIVGKWHLGHLPEYLPTRQGFDYYFGIPFSNDMNAVKWGLETFLSEPDINMWQVPLMENEEVIEQPANQFTITKRYTEKAIDFINENKGEPFFLYLAHSMVHTPLFASRGFQNTSVRGLFGDVMNEVDWSVGRIIQTLETLDLDKKTLVVFTSDNGPWLMMREHGGSAGLLRDGKGTTWEGGMRVPGIFYMPGKISPGIKTDLGCTLDLMPTIAAMSGTELPGDRVIDGVDMSPVLFDNQKGNRDHFIYYRKNKIYAVRKGPYKAHYITETCYTEDNERKEYEIPLLFDVNMDPGEHYNHAEDFPEVIRDIDLLVKAHKSTVKYVASELEKYD